MKMKLIGVVVLAASLLMAGQAMAADPGFNWNGFYAGVNVGGAWSSHSVTVNGPFGSAEFGVPALDTSGVIGGGQIGYNWQCGCWLFGIEADFQGASLSETVTAVDRFTGDVASFEQSMEWFGTVRGRAGWLAMPCLLIYGTGGLAYGDVKNSVTFGTFPVILEASNSDVKAGWTAGGGVEWALTKCWSVKAEYLFMDLGSRSFAIPGVAQVELGQNTQMARMGVNFKF